MDKILVSIVDENNNEIIDSVKFTKLINNGSISIDGDKLYGSDNFIIDAKRCKISARLPINNIELKNELLYHFKDRENLIEDSVEIEEFPVLAITEESVMNIFSVKNIFYRHFNNIVQTWEDRNSNNLLYCQSNELYNIIYRIFKGLPSTTYTELSINSSISKFFAMISKIIFNEYENDIMSQNAVNSYIENTFSWLSSLQKTNLSLSLYLALESQITVFNISQLSNTIFDIFTNGYSIYNQEVEYEYNFLSETLKAEILSAFFSSIIKYESYNELVINYYNNEETPQIYSNAFYDRICTPFYGMKEIVSVFSGNSIGDSNGFRSCLHQQNNIKFCKKNNINGMFYNCLQFGKTQLKTEGVTTESGIEIIQQPSNYIPTKLFIPVKRTFTLKNSDYFIPYFQNGEYKFYIENFDRAKLMHNRNSECILSTFGSEDTNWMYFDSIECTELILNESNDTFVDNIPVYDELDGLLQNNYGLYIYEDYFNNFYTKTKSSFMNKYIKVFVNNIQVFYGVIDYQSIKINKKSISFDSIDAIGVLIENIRRLSNFISFSQFDTGDDITADKNAGSILGKTIEAIIKEPFPYKANFMNIDFSLPDIKELNNKILSDISMEDAFLAGIQISKILLYSDAYGKIQYTEFNENQFNFDIGEIKHIDGFIMSDSEDNNLNNDKFSIDKIKNIAGFSKFAPSVASFFNSIRNKYSTSRNIEILGQKEQINILDKVIFENNKYIVMEKSNDLRKKTIKLNLLGNF